MRFIGSKQNLLPLLSSLAAERAPDGGVFCDLFAGTAAVGAQFKKAGFAVRSTDLLYFSYVLQKTRLELNRPPEFAALLPRLGKKATDGLFNGDRAGAVIQFLNRLAGEEGFVFRNYTPEGTRGGRHERRYFTAENGRKIDAIRGAIARWKSADWIDEDEYCFLLCALVEAAPSVSNISGTYSAFLKNWDARALKPLRLSVPEVIPSACRHVAANEDAVEFAARVRGADILYLDPPYNARQYAPNYHILETVARGDEPEIRGVSGMRNYDGQKSAFCSRATALAALARVLERADCRHVMLSYNDEGILKPAEILSVLKRHGKTVVVERDYARYKSNSGGSGRGRVTERVYCARKTHPKNALNDLSGAEWPDLRAAKLRMKTSATVAGRRRFIRARCGI